MTQPWPVVALAEVLRERDELPPAEDIVSGQIKIIAKIAFGDGRIQLRNSSVTNTDMILVRPGDLVVSGINAAKGAIALHTQQDEPIAATIHYSAYSVNKARAEPEYLWWYLRSEAFRKLLLKALPGGIKTEVKARRLLAVEIPLPDPTRQKDLVCKLNTIACHAAEARKLRIESGALISRAMSSFMSDALSGVGPLGRFQEVLLLKPRSGPSFVTSPDWNGTPVLMPSAVTDFGVDLSRVEFGMGSESVSEKDRLEPGDILIARGNKRDQVGNAGVVPQEARGWVGANLLMRMKIDPEKTDPHFCIYWLRSPLMRARVYRAMKGTNPNIQKINQQSILSFPFPTSLGVTEQQRIVAYLDKLQAQTDHLEYQDLEASTALGGLLQRAVSEAFTQ
jgi:type I restriction enzyme S subunit